MTSSLSPRQERALRALCDTYVGAVEPPTVESDDPTGFWGRSASDLDAHVAVADHVLGELDDAATRTPIVGTRTGSSSATRDRPTSPHGPRTCGRSGRDPATTGSPSRPTSA